MSSIPDDALPLLASFAPAFSPATFCRARLLAVAALLTTGRRTVSNLLRTVATLAEGDPSSYHRVLSQARWSGLRLAALWTRLLLPRFWPAGTISLVGDDTVSGHPGKKVYGKARHRDAVRSGHSYTAWRWGHKWVVLAVLVQFPFARRPWALPLLVALYRSKEDNRKRGRPHKTPAQLMCLLLRVLLRWFPDRSFRFAGDAGYGNHDMPDFAGQTGGGCTWSASFTPRPTCTDRRRQSRARSPMAARAKRARSSPRLGRWWHGRR